MAQGIYLAHYQQKSEPFLNWLSKGLIMPAYLLDPASYISIPCRNSASFPSPLGTYTRDTRDKTWRVLIVPCSELFMMATD